MTQKWIATLKQGNSQVFYQHRCLKDDGARRAVPGNLEPMPGLSTLTMTALTMTGHSASLPRCASLAVLFALALSGCGRRVSPPAPPPEVLVTEVTQEDVPIYDDFVGTLEGSVNASIRARVQGYLTSQDYKEGGVVKKGDLLFQIDPRPFEAALAQAKAALTQAEASAQQAEMIARRNLDLFSRKT